MLISGAARVAQGLLRTAGKDCSLLLEAKGKYSTRPPPPPHTRAHRIASHRNATHARQRLKDAASVWLCQNGGSMYQNVLTQQTVRTPPRLPRGGILADDMVRSKCAPI
eukprot:SAG31_NODE_21000_length_560_cov_0.561822_1_plen_108_part_01